ncbi:hypothetical protein IWQ60_009480 [Tieghemiomyces parasiticus]|uniref:WD repeat-containing protein JIP5 n=1 Tax=Tieghemiomyces parasiticus TaxID=78921 RepID=A0A9W8DPH6_9FUNG|nr:hypothetical protein IWQ60_009480 [Tieghemiomyces parasiticus]
MKSDRIEFQHQPVAMEFHPKENLLATGLVTGELYVHRILPWDGTLPAVTPAPNSLTTTKPVRPRRVVSQLAFQTRPNPKSCRGFSFNPDGTRLYLASKDKSLSILDPACDGKVLHRYADAHDEPITAIQSLDSQLLATGAEDGSLKIWDVRTPRKMAVTGDFSHHRDYISSIQADPTGRTMLVTSGDGTLSALDYRRSKLIHQSEDLEDEPLCVMPIKKQKWVAVGMEAGVINIFKWGAWGYYYDRLPGHPDAVSAMCRMDQDTLCTGAGDGIIRVISVHPNSLVGIVGVHGDFPIEKLDFSYDGNHLASMSHDNIIKIWDANQMRRMDPEQSNRDLDSDDLDDDSDDEDDGKGQQAKSTTVEPAELKPLDEIILTPKEEAEVKRRLLAAVGKNMPPPQVLNVLTKRIAEQIRAQKVKKAEKAAAEQAASEAKAQAEAEAAVAAAEAKDKGKEGSDADWSDVDDEDGQAISQNNTTETDKEREAQGEASALQTLTDDPDAAPITAPSALPALEPLSEVSTLPAVRKPEDDSESEGEDQLRRIVRNKKRKGGNYAMNKKLKENLKTNNGFYSGL